jgi:hypothetical protein
VADDPTIVAEQVPCVDDWRNGVSTTVAEAGAAQHRRDRKFNPSRAHHQNSQENLGVLFCLGLLSK